MMSILLGSAALIGVGYAILFWPYFIDDSYITFAYSKNFALGNGLVLRPTTNVEATSSFLWALLLGISSAATSITAPIASKILGALSWFGAISCVLWIFSQGINKSQIYTLFITVPISVSFGLWSNYGMENGLLGLLCMLATIFLPRQNRNFEFIFSPLVLLSIYTIRPEGFGLVATLLCSEFIRRSVGRQAVIVTAGITAIGVIGYEIYGYLNYGTFLPDSALAKLNEPLIDRIYYGMAYTYRYAWFDWPVILCLISACYDLWKRKIQIRLPQQASIILGLALVFACVIFVLISGGDWMPAARFYSFLIPFCFGYMTWSLTREVRLRSGLLLVFVLLSIASQIKALHDAFPSVVAMQRGEDLTLQKIVDDMNPYAKPSDVLALSDIGYASYAFVGDIFDWWGLASRVVRNKGEAIGKITSETIRNADPHFIVVYSNSSDGPSIIDTPKQVTKTSLPIIEDRKLMNNYCRLKSYIFWEDRWHVVIARKDVWLERFKDKIDTEFEIKSCIQTVREYR